MSILLAFDSLWFWTALLALVAVNFTGVAFVLTLRGLRRREAPPTTWPAISILVPCEGAEGGLEENLEALLRAPYPGAREVIFAANSEKDGSIGVIDRVLARHDKDPGLHTRAVKVFSEHGPVALNRKIQHLMAAEAEAKYDVIVAADSDTRPGVETLSVLVGTLMNDERRGLVFAPPRFPDRGGLGDRLLSFGFAASLHAFHTLKSLSDFVKADPPVVGSLMAFRRSALHRAGGYRELADHIGDDLELGRRIQAQGFEIGTAPITVDCPVPDLTLSSLLSKVHRWIVVGTSYAPWRILSYPMLLAPLPLLLLLSLAVGFLEDPPGYFWASVPAFVVARALFAGVIGWRAYRRPLTAWDLVLLPLWEMVLAGCAVAAIFQKEVIWRGRRIRVDPSGTMRIVEVPSLVLGP